MSLGAELDQALIRAPWQLKADPDDHLWLIKYAPHPSKPGYVFIATDLERVLFEALTSPAILYRLEEVREALGESNGAEEGDIKSQTESALSSLGNLFGGAWGKTKLEVKKHDYHDAIFELRHSSFSWQFFTSEIKGRQPLHILANHLVVPLIGLSHPSAIQNPPDGEGTQGVLAILKSTDILKELGAATLRPEPSTSRSPGPSRHSRQKEQEEELVPSSSPVPEEQPDEGEEEEYRSPSATPTPTPQPPSPTTTSKPPRSARKAAATSRDGEDSPPPRKLGIAKRRQASPEPTDSRATTVASGSAPPSSGEKDPPPSKTKKRASPAKSSSSPPPEPPRPSQKAKREKEKEEEEALEKRREELKRKMARGGGGRLGARRGRL